MPGGFRTVILFRLEVRAVFVYGFAKSERDNIGNGELAEFRKLAALLLAYGDGEVAEAIASGLLIEVDDG